MFDKVKQITIIINLKTIIIVILAVLSTYLCRKFDLNAEFPLTLIATAVVFPIVFSIGGAYKRREMHWQNTAQLRLMAVPFILLRGTGLKLQMIKF